MAMNILWEGVKATAGIVGQAAVETGMKGKLQTELLLISHEIENRKRAFGEELYEYVEPLSKTPDFYAANDKMTDTLRGPLLKAQREVAALDIKRRKLLDKVQKTETAEKSAYTPATDWQDTLRNTAKKAGFVSHHAKLKTELGMVDVQIKDFKQVFGLELFQILVDLEDTEGWLPTVRDIRSIYDQARRDIEKIHVRRKEKEVELSKLGGVPMVTSSEDSKRGVQENDDDDQTPSYFKQVAAAESGPASTYGATATAGQSSTYSVPAVPVAVAAVPQFPDPFASSAPPPATHQQPFGYSVQQQQPAYVDPFASSGHDAFGGTALPMGSGDAFGSSTAAPTYDPFASFNPSAPRARMNSDPFGGTTTIAPPQYDDPFAVLDGSNERSHTTDNPLFRY